MGRNPSAQLIELGTKSYLIDCGEGAQNQLRRYHVKLQHLSVIAISHAHGDHYFGLAGLLNTMQLLGRKSPLTLIAPQAVHQVFELQMQAAGHRLAYPFKFIPLDEVTPSEGRTLLFEDDQMQLFGFPLRHRILCSGFQVVEKPKPRRFLAEIAAKYRIPIAQIQAIKQGSDFVTDEGEIVPNALLTEAPQPPRSYAYVSDTRPIPEMLEFLSGTSCLYHEATFTSTHARRAVTTFHSTAAEAGRVAVHLRTEKLIIGHFSARYKELSELLAEARSVFTNTDLAEEGKRYLI